MRTLLQCFHQAFGETKIDAKFAKRLELYRIGMVTRNKDLMEFFGGNLLGTHRIWFKDQYLTEFFEKVIDLTFDEIKIEVRQATTINHTFKVSGDIMNLTIMYLIHRCMRSPGLTDKQRYNAIYDLAMVFFYRCLCILISDQFNFTADPKVAQQAYANLSLKFLIKKLGTWNKVIDYQARNLVDHKKSIHWNSLYNFDHDEDIVYAINDSQNRIKSILKEYYSELDLVAKGGESVGISKSLVVDMEGEESLREKQTGSEAYVFYIRNMIMDKYTFIRDDLLDVAASSNTNTSKRSVREVLEWMSTNAMDAKSFSEIDKFVSMVLVLCVYFMDTQMDRKRLDDGVYVAKTLKDLFLATRSADTDLKQVRSDGEVFVKKALGKVSTSLLNATRTAVIIYICLRALARGSS